MELETSKERWREFRQEVSKSPLCRKLLHPALCGSCALFLGDILTQEVWAKPLPWWSGSRFKHRRARSFPMDPKQIDCPVCQMLVIAWRQGSTHRSMTSTWGRFRIETSKAMGQPEPFDDHIHVDLEEISGILLPCFRIEGIEMEITAADLSGSAWLDGFFSQERHEPLEATPGPIEAPASPPQPVANRPILTGEDLSERVLKPAQPCDPYSYSPDPIGAIAGHIWQPKLPSLDSPYAFAQIRQWLEECHKHHAECKIPLPVPLPTRIVDVGEEEHETPRLYVTNGHTSPYLALSYCWGEEKSTVLTMGTLELFKAGIPSDAMPPTILDAFKVTRRLGYRYIWIDSLNIIQDSVDDWKAEAQKMREIYEWADLVIAGDESYSRSVGLFTPRNAQITKGAAGGGSPLIIQRKALGVNPNDFYLSFRGWTLQESVVARAIIHFNSTFLCWECRHHRVVEAQEPLLAQDLISVSQKNRASQWNDLFQIRVSQFPWYLFVTNFSHRQLSFSADAPAALAGVAELCERMGWHSGRYLCGMWEDDLPQALLWSTDTGNDMAGFTYDFPSWSWFDHFNRTVHWPLNFHRREVMAKTPLDCVYHPSETFTTSKSRLDSIISGELSLTGYILPFDEEVLRSIVAHDIEPWSKITMHKIRHLMGGSFREPGLAMDHMQAWCSIGTSRVWKTIEFPLFLVRICSWPTLREARFDDGYVRSKNYFDSYFLLLEHCEKTDGMNSEARRSEGNKWNRPWELEELDKDPSMHWTDYNRESMKFLAFVSQGSTQWLASGGIHGKQVPRRRYPATGTLSEGLGEENDLSQEDSDAEPNQPSSKGRDVDADIRLLSLGQSSPRYFRKVGIGAFTHHKHDDSFMQKALLQKIILL